MEHTSQNDYEDRIYQFINKHRSVVDSAQSCYGSHRLNLEIRIDEANAITTITALISVVVTMF
jgi:hypothetical protein